MKKTLSILLVILVGSVAHAQNYSAFQEGEWLKYRLHYGFLNASYATMKLEKTQIKGKTVYRAIGKGKTTGFASLFFKVDDTYESFFELDSVRPVYFKRDIYEGGYTKHIEIDYDFEGNSAKIYNIKDSTSFSLDIHDKIQDILSSTYYLRENFSTENLEIGDEIPLDMLFDDDGVYDFKLRYLGEEIIKTKFGKVPCLAFRPLVKSGRIFREQESLTLWVSNDQNRIPVRIKADLRVGSIKADLEGYNGLKNQFTLIMD
ncbi:MAG: DUF3108 domain-containing protein [Flavobacteriaceae bacterium]